MSAKNLASAISIVLGASAIGVGTAHAASAFFPHVVMSPSVTTIVSVANTSADNYNQSGTGPGDFLHYRLYYKDAANNLDPCVEVNAFRPTSQFDLQTIDLGGVFGAFDLGVLFNDPSFFNDWRGPNQTFALGSLTGLVASRGYLVVDNADASGASLGGEAFVFEFANGATWGYQAFAQFGNEPETEFDYEFASSAEFNFVSIMPFEEISTAFMVTPVTTNMVPGGSNAFTAAVRYASPLDPNIAFFDRDEGAISGRVEQGVVCVGRIDASDLLTDAALSLVPDGGWSILELSDPAVVYKLEYGIGSFNGEAINGVFNNAFQLMPVLVD
ncbi:MAG: hypothetical protein K9L70_04125 [Thiohalocapsa sp.]|nr:hypothetical protein [Thiohalocapsa sp.]MCF7992105.1 hypothetical protein [Thiohalocapsa sp.]